MFSVVSQWCSSLESCKRASALNHRWLLILQDKGINHPWPQGSLLSRHVCLAGHDIAFNLQEKSPWLVAPAQPRALYFSSPSLFLVVMVSHLEQGEGFCFSGYVPFFSSWTRKQWELRHRQLLGEIKTKHLKTQTHTPLQKILCQPTTHQPTNKTVLQTKLHLFL